MGNEWWGTPDSGDDDGWQANWNCSLSREEHARMVRNRDEKQGYRENRQGSKEDRVDGEGSEEDSENGGREVVIGGARMCISERDCDFLPGADNRCKRIGICLKRPLG